MSLISRLKVWGSEALKSADLNGEFNNVVNTFNNLDSGSTIWTNVKATTITPVTNNIAMGSLKLTGLSAGSSAGDSVCYEQLFSTNYWGYRRPVLVYNSATVVNIETGINGNPNQIQIVFPDGTVRTDSTAGHIQCNLAQVASLSGSVQSGIRTGSVAANTTYAVYAVKSQANTTDIIAVADVVTPVQSNFATINSNFGTHSWVYLGYVRYGDNSGATTAICAFVQAGNTTIFTNTVSSGNSLVNSSGILLTNSASATALTYSISSGLGAAQIPNNTTLARYTAVCAIAGNKCNIRDSSGARYKFNFGTSASGDNKLVTYWDASSEGCQVNTDSAGAIAIVVSGWLDGVLGVGANPLL